MEVTPRPHDLLRLAPDAVTGGLPRWAAASLAACPWAVVRRAPHPSRLIPVGVRGAARCERQAALVPSTAVLGRVPPEWLNRRVPRLPRPAAALAAVRRCLAAELGEAAAWGPVGGVGFELATGHRVTHPGSDLDLLIRTPDRLPRELAARLLTVFCGLACAVDCQLETPRGGVALVEWARTGGPVLARTGRGPELVDDPWAPI
ncbi:phosphoribosyl-dephospho-CoA transferase [Nonomuraea maritima]|uniref:Phosphoribosyl-dephospho-CoA transferase n=1 Tax=Nonomuraea maritima TaxID=683260 RepID=A0A1G9BE36_9ACTN|nr:malonate decarboxylase holo-ACP synthase [Nonomuraea maritima]SDK37792.1 phosphoribosyl-dephospho-CoA transferase [Nonomuraea maritima]